MRDLIKWETLTKTILISPEIFLYTGKIEANFIRIFLQYSISDHFGICCENYLATFTYIILALFASFGKIFEIFEIIGNNHCIFAVKNAHSHACSVLYMCVPFFFLLKDRNISTIYYNILLKYTIFDEFGLKKVIKLAVMVEVFDFVRFAIP